MRSPAQLVEPLFPNLWIGFLERSLITDRCLLNVLDINRAPLAVVAIKHGIIGLAAHYGDELLGEVHGILKRTVQAKAAQRVVQMSGIARKKHPALPERAGNALMDAVDGAMDGFVAPRFGDDRLQAFLDALVPERLVFTLIGT